MLEAFQKPAPVDFFLVSKVKSALAGDALTAGELKSAWDGVTGMLIIADYAGAFQKWIERFRKCKDISGNFVEK